MKISTIETFIVEQELNEPFYFSQWEYNRRKVCLVKISTPEGLYGWGEGYGPAEVVQAGIQFLTPFLLGSDPLHVEAIWQILYRRSLDYARRGVLVAAISALDVALWDLKGKLLEQPVSVLLGGPRRSQVQVYATGMYFSHVEDLPRVLAEEAQTYIEQGFSALKMKVGLGIQEDFVNVQSVRSAIGPGIRLMVDANHAYGRKEALAFCRKIEPLQITWFEEPLSPEDYTGCRELRQRTDIPIAAGECEYLTFGFKQLVENQCVDIAQPDLCAAGGLTEAKRIISLVNAFGTDVLLHSWGTGIAFAAALHLTSTIDVLPGRLRMPEPLLEMDRTENPLRDELTFPVFKTVNGFVRVPEAPGLGVDVDPLVLSKFST